MRPRMETVAVPAHKAGTENLMTTHMLTLFDQGLAVVSGPQRERNHRVLQPVLANLIAFALDVKQLHWNVVGPNFRTIHLHLDEIYSSVQKAIDDVAERMAASGHSPTGTLRGVAGQVDGRDLPAGFLTDKEVLRLGGLGLHELCGEVRSRMAEIENVDTVTADLLHRIVGELEKHHWMIRASSLGPWENANA